MCERMVLVWGWAHAYLGVRSTERSQSNGRQWMADVYGAYWTGDYHHQLIMTWKHDQEFASGSGMNSISLEKVEIKKIEKKKKMLKEKLFTL